MRKIILKSTGVWNKNKITFSLEKGITSFYCEPAHIEKIRELAKVEIISEDSNADLIIGDKIHCITVKDKADEKRIVELAKSAPVIVILDNWKIIPIENILAQTDNIIVAISIFFAS